MSEKLSLSDFWRRNRSSEEAFELATLLRQTQSFIGLFGEAATVKWTGQVSETDIAGKSISLNYGLVKGQKSPLDGQVVDAVIGEGLHEGGHLAYSYGKADLRHVAIRSKVPPDVLLRAADVIEDFYIEKRIGRQFPSLEGYINAARDFYLGGRTQWPQEFLDKLGRQVSADDVLSLWAGIVLAGLPVPAGLRQKLFDLISALVSLTLRSENIHQGAKRISLSLDATRKLVAFLDDQAQSPPPPTGVPITQKGHPQEGREGQGRLSERAKTEPCGDDVSDRQDKDREPVTEESSDTGGGAEEAEDSEGGGKADGTEEWDVKPESFDFGSSQWVKLPDELKKQLSAILDQEAEDISSEVLAATGGKLGGRQDGPIVLRLAAQTPRVADYEKFIGDIPLKIRQIWDWDKKQRTRRTHMRDSGRIDSRFLAQAGAGSNKVFQTRETLDAPSLGCVVLIDLSGSMGGPREMLVKTVALGLYRGFAGKRGVSLAILSYPGREGVELCRMVDARISKPRLGEQIAGSTPTGTAIAGVAVRINQLVAGKDKLIIHVTDGRPDQWESVTEAVRLCRSHKITVMTLTTEPVREMDTQIYGGLVEHIPTFKQLPDAIASLLKKRLHAGRSKI